MAKKLNVAPTKSNHLLLKQQLEFAQNGFDLLEQKRQILVYELMSRLGRARDIERRVNEKLGLAFEALRQASLDIGSAALDNATLAVRMRHNLKIANEQVIGIHLPKVSLQSEGGKVQFGVGGTSVLADTALQRFMTVLPLLAQLAELENSVVRLASELRKTQRRCNALSRIFMPQYEATIDYITASLEEREREAFVNLRMVKERLASEAEAEQESAHV